MQAVLNTLYPKTVHRKVKKSPRSAIDANVDYHAAHSYRDEAGPGSDDKTE
jgi:hypothetical protein